MAGSYNQLASPNNIEEEILVSSNCAPCNNLCTTAQLNRKTETTDTSTVLEGHAQTFEGVNVTDNHWLPSSAALRGESSVSFCKPGDLNQEDCSALGFNGSTGSSRFSFSLNVSEPANYVDMKCNGNMSPLDHPTKHQSSPAENPRMTVATDAADGGADVSRESCRTDHKTLSPGKNRHRTRIGEPASRSNSPYSSDSLSSSSVWEDRSASTTPKDTFFYETNENSSSGFDTGSDNKERTTPWSMANFDRVLHDAPKREHIRSRKVTDKSRSNQGTKVGYQSDSGSSSSQSRNKPGFKALQGTRSKLHAHGRAADIPRNDWGTSTSSGTLSHGHFDKSKKKCEAIAENASQGTDTGISTANTSGQSTQYQSNFSFSSSSGACVESSRRAGKERTKNLPGKLVSTHYHSIRTQNRNEVSLDVVGATTPHDNLHFHQGHRDQSGLSNGDSASSSGSESKRRRFNRTFVLLRHCGLLELTMQTASLMQQNCVMNKQLSALRQETGVLYNAINHLSSTQPSASFDIATAHGILKNLKDIMSHDAPPHGNQPNSLHARRVTVKRNSSGETVSPDSNTQSSSAHLNSGSST